MRGKNKGELDTNPSYPALSTWNPNTKSGEGKEQEEKPSEWDKSWKENIEISKPLLMQTLSIKGPKITKKNANKLARLKTKILVTAISKKQIFLQAYTHLRSNNGSRVEAKNNLVCSDI